MPPNKAKAARKHKQTNLTASCQFIAVFYFLDFPVIILADSVVFQPQSTCSAAVWPAASPTHLLWRTRRRTWRCHRLQSPPHLGLNSLHHIILQVWPLLKPRSLISGTFCLLRAIFSTRSESIWILLPFRSNLAPQAVTFVRFSTVAIQSECCSCGLHSQNLWR